VQKTEGVAGEGAHDTVHVELADTLEEADEGVLREQLSRLARFDMPFAEAGIALLDEGDDPHLAATYGTL
jgi:hypothetical protein